MATEQSENDPKPVNPNTHESPTVAGEKRRSTSEENGIGDVNLSKHFTASSAEDASSRTTHDVEGTPGERTPTMINDLGELILPTQTRKEVGESTNSLTPAQKYHLLKRHNKPSSSYVFPTKYMHGCNRSFKHAWLQRWTPWLVYSERIDGGFCVACAMFSSDTDRKGMLVTKPFTCWTKATSVIDGHAKKSYHMDSVQKMEGFIAATEKPERTIPVLLDQEKGKQIANNRHILTCIIAAIVYCGRQCIALRGDCESTIGHGNPGNFLAMLKIMAEHDPVLKHLYTPAMKNATYVSPRSQNDIIDVIDRGVIQQALLQEINGATFFTIMSDEVTTFNKQELALVVRFVDNNDNIREEFLEFVASETDNWRLHCFSHPRHIAPTGTLCKQSQRKVL